MQRLIFEKGKNYVIVFESKDTKHKETRRYGDYIPDYLQKYRPVGIFEMMTVRDRHWEKPQENPEEYNGIPEGKVYDRWSKKYKIADKYNPVPMRHKFQTKMKQILKKAKELMALGIDRKTALQAARKYSCHT